MKEHRHALLRVLTCLSLHCQTLHMPHKEWHLTERASTLFIHNIQTYHRSSKSPKVDCRVDRMHRVMLSLLVQVISFTMREKLLQMRREQTKTNYFDKQV